MSDDRPLVIAHRGASTSCPENTLAAFREAVRVGVRMLECDVRLTRDGVPIVLHDALLDRTTSGNGPARDATIAEIRRLSAGYPVRFGTRFVGERVPTLDEVLRLVRGGVRLLIELKWDFQDSGRGHDLVRSVVDMVNAIGARGSTAIISFDDGLLAEAARAAAEIPRGFLLAPDDARDPVQAALGAGARVAIAAPNRIDERTAQAARAAGVLLATYGVETRERLEPLLSLGLYAFATDHAESFVDHPGVRLAPA